MKWIDLNFDSSILVASRELFDDSSASTTSIDLGHFDLVDDEVTRLNGECCDEE